MLASTVQFSNNDQDHHQHPPPTPPPAPPQGEHHQQLMWKTDGPDHPHATDTRPATTGTVQGSTHHRRLFPQDPTVCLDADPVPDPAPFPPPAS